MRTALFLIMWKDCGIFSFHFLCHFQVTPEFAMSTVMGIQSKLSILKTPSKIYVY